MNKATTIIFPTICPLANGFLPADRVQIAEKFCLLNRQSSLPNLNENSMGSCISKCKPKSHSLKESNLVQDKLVISQAPTIPSTVHLSKKVPNSPSSSPLFSSTTTGTTSSCSPSKSPSSSCSSSISISKDRSFSNDFLWHCVKDNPHVIPADTVKSSSFKVHAPPKSVVASLKSNQLSQSTHAVSTPQKRARAGSPVLARQKSFRREPERPITPTRRNLCSSPSRRLNSNSSGRGILKNQPKENWNPDVGVKSNVDSISFSSRNKENLRGTSPSKSLIRDGSRSKKTETCTHHINHGADQNAGGLVVSNHGWNSLPIDDIDNPLISLDCFIFL